MLVVVPAALVHCWEPPAVRVVVQGRALQGRVQVVQVPAVSVHY